MSRLDSFANLENNPQFIRLQIRAISLLKKWKDNIDARQMNKTGNFLKKIGDTAALILLMVFHVGNQVSMTNPNALKQLGENNVKVLNHLLQFFKGFYQQGETLQQQLEASTYQPEWHYYYSCFCFVVHINQFILQFGSPEEAAQVNQKALADELRALLATINNIGCHIQDEQESLDWYSILPRIPLLRDPIVYRHASIAYANCAASYYNLERYMEATAHYVSAINHRDQITEKTPQDYKEIGAYFQDIFECLDKMTAKEKRTGECKSQAEECVHIVTSGLLQVLKILFSSLSEKSAESSQIEFRESIQVMLEFAVTLAETKQNLNLTHPSFSLIASLVKIVVTHGAGHKFPNKLLSPLLVDQGKKTNECRVLEALALELQLASTTHSISLLSKDVMKLQDRARDNFTLTEVKSSVPQAHTVLSEPPNLDQNLDSGKKPNVLPTKPAASKKDTSSMGEGFIYSSTQMQLSHRINSNFYFSGRATVRPDLCKLYGKPKLPSIFPFRAVPDLTLSPMNPELDAFLEKFSKLPSASNS